MNLNLSAEMGRSQLPYFVGLLGSSDEMVDVETPERDIAMCHRRRFLGCKITNAWADHCKRFSLGMCDVQGLLGGEGSPQT